MGSMTSPADDVCTLVYIMYKRDVVHWEGNFVFLGLCVCVCLSIYSIVRFCHVHCTIIGWPCYMYTVHYCFFFHQLGASEM